MVDGRQIATRTLPNDRCVLDDINSTHLATNSVGSNEITDNSVTPAKLDATYQEAFVQLTQNAVLFRDISGTNPTSTVEVNDEDAANFAEADGTTGIRVAFDIPDNYDTTGSVEVYLRVSPSTSEAADFRIQTDFRINGGTLQGTSDVTVTPSATLNTQTLVGPVRTISAGTLAAGDGLALLIKRLAGDVADTHTGDMRLFRVLLKYAV